MPLSTEVLVAIIFGVLGLAVAAAGVVFAFMAVLEARRNSARERYILLEAGLSSEVFGDTGTSGVNQVRAGTLPHSCSGVSL